MPLPWKTKQNQIGNPPFKRIFICIDGTQNASEVAPMGLWARTKYVVSGLFHGNAKRTSPDPTNVLLLTRALWTHDLNGHPQVVHYIRGVGTDDAAGAVRRFVASALGKGLSQTVQDAYVFLTNNYSVSDKVYILGFSRGAAAARSLSGLTELIGILPKSLMDQFPAAWDYYNTPPERRPAMLACIRAKYPDLASIIVFGEGHRKSHELECESISGEGLHPHGLEFDQLGPLRGNAQDNQYVAMPLHFVGVWDTVLTAPSEGYQEQRLAWNVGCARQALAIHEFREPFSPQVWQKRCSHQSVVQTWFPGSHCDVGGGNNNGKRSALTLRWMMAQLLYHSSDIQFNLKYCVKACAADTGSEFEFEHTKVPWVASPWSVRTMGGKWQGQELQFKSLVCIIAMPQRCDEPEESAQKFRRATSDSKSLKYDPTEESFWYS